MTHYYFFRMIHQSEKKCQTYLQDFQLFPHYLRLSSGILVSSIFQHFLKRTRKWQFLQAKTKCPHEMKSNMPLHVNSVIPEVIGAAF